MPEVGQHERERGEQTIPLPQGPAAATRRSFDLRQDAQARCMANMGLLVVAVLFTPHADKGTD